MPGGGGSSSTTGAGGSGFTGAAAEAVEAERSGAPEPEDVEGSSEGCEASPEALASATATSGSGSFRGRRHRASLRAASTSGNHIEDRTTTSGRPKCRTKASRASALLRVVRRHSHLIGRLGLQSVAPNRLNDLKVLLHLGERGPGRGTRTLLEGSREHPQAFGRHSQIRSTHAKSPMHGCEDARIAGVLPTSRSHWAVRCAHHLPNRAWRLQPDR